MNARELMTPYPQVVTGDEPVSLAAQVMRDFDIGMVPVVDDRGHLHPIGVITDRDIAIRCVADWQSADQKVEDFMSVDRLTTVQSDTDVEGVMQKMARNQVRRVLVVDDARLVGVIAQADLVLKEGPREPELVEDVIAHISSPAPAAV